MKSAPRIPPKGLAIKPGRADASAPWESRLCELELRLTRLESENHRLRNTCQQLETVSANYARSYDLAPVGLATLDPRKVIVNINRTGAALVGRDQSRLLQRRFDFLVAPEDVPTFEARVRECRVLRKILSWELCLRGTAGEPVPVRFTVVPVLNEKSRVTQLEIAFVDLTERKHVEMGLRATEQNLRTLIETSPHPIQLLDANARWLLANPAALELFDLTGANYYHKRGAQLAACSPLYRPVLAARERKDRAVLETRRTSRCDERVPKPDGSLRVFDVIRVPLLHPGRPPKGLAILSYDITERKESEAAMELVSRLPEENPFPVIRLNQPPSENTTNFSRALPPRPLPKWVRVKADNWKTQNFGWIMEAEVERSPGVSTTMQILLKHPPVVDKARFDKLVARSAWLSDYYQHQFSPVDKRVGDANAAARLQRLPAQVANLVAAQDKHWGDMSQSANNYSSKERQIMNDAQLITKRAASAATELQAVQVQLAAYQMEVYKVDLFGVFTGQYSGGLPVFDLGAIY